MIRASLANHTTHMLTLPQLLLLCSQRIGAVSLYVVVRIAVLCQMFFTLSHKTLTISWYFSTNLSTTYANKHVGLSYNR